MVAAILIGGLGLAFAIWLLEAIYKKVKSKAPKENYKYYAEISCLNDKINEKKLSKRKGMLGVLDRYSVLEQEEEKQNLINKLK